MKTNAYRFAHPALCGLALALLTFVAVHALAVEPEKKGKLIHTGLIWLKNPGNETDRQRLIEAAHRFAREIPEVLSLAVGRPQRSTSPLVDSSFDICLTMHFENQAAMDRYAKHPVHEKAAQEVFLPLSQKILFYDFIAE